MRPQLMKFQLLQKACTYFFPDQVFIPLIRMISFENLYVIDIIILNSFLISNSASTKSINKVKKSTNGKFISCRDL